MIKKIKVLLTNSLFLLSLSLNTASQDFAYTPQNSVVAIDLHDVVTQFSSKKAYQAFCKLKNKGTFIGNVLEYLFTSKKKRKCIENSVLANSTDQQSSLAVLNPHIPNHDMVSVIQELKSLGYQIYACSNIGEKSYQYMQDMYPEVFNLFDGYYISNASTGYIKKNNPEFFVQAAKMIDTCAGFSVEKIIFIDNELANLKLAQATDSRFVGLFFKNVIQIREKLYQTGLIISQ